jgi:beta-catenin-like protein 1
MSLTAIFENFVAFRPELSSLLITKTTILEWLLTRIQSTTHEDNRGYAAELLSILLQDNRNNRLALGKQDGVETMLKVLSVRMQEFIGDCVSLLTLDLAAIP